MSPVRIECVGSDRIGPARCVLPLSSCREVQVATPLPAVNPDVFNACGDDRQRQQGDETPQSEAKKFAELYVHVVDGKGVLPTTGTVNAFGGGCIYWHYSGEVVCAQAGAVYIHCGASHGTKVRIGRNPQFLHGLW